MGNFDKDQERTNEYKQYLKRFYRVYCKDGEFVCLEGNGTLTIEFQKKSVDAIGISPKTNRPVYMEEKYDFHVPNNFCLETTSNTAIKPEIPGWMATAESDILIYSFIWIKDTLDVYVLDFPQLRKWFWTMIDSELCEWREHVVPDSSNHTASRIVPIKQVVASGVYTRRYLVTLEGSVIPIHPLGNPHDVLKLHGLPFIPLAKDDNAA